MRGPLNERHEVFEVLSPEQSTTDDRLVMLAPTLDEPGMGMGTIDDYVVLLHMMPGTQNDIVVEGVWGAYRDAVRKALVFGRLTGSARWLRGEGRTIHLTLEYTSAVTPESWHGSHLLVPVAPDETDSNVVHHWETDEAAFPVLTRELLPRFPEYVLAAKHFVPFMTTGWIDARIRPNSGRVNVDGLLNESYWSQASSVVSIPTDADATLRVITTPEGLILGFAGSTPLSVDPEFELYILPGYDVPRSRSAYFSGRIHNDRIEADWNAPEGSLEVGNLLSTTIVSSDSGWSAEIQIPFEALGRRTPPLPGEFFRLNVALQDGSDHSAVRCWGWPNTSETEHGLLVHFVSNQETGRI
jgi:hypothetical protein